MTVAGTAVTHNPDGWCECDDCIGYMAEDEGVTPESVRANLDSIRPKPSRRRGPRLVRSFMDEVYIVTRYTEKVGSNGVPYLIAHTKYRVSEEDLSSAFLVTIPEEDRDKDEIELVITRFKAVR